jgi:chemotaxis response regulator CheB
MSDEPTVIDVAALTADAERQFAEAVRAGAVARIRAILESRAEAMHELRKLDKQRKKLESRIERADKTLDALRSGRAEAMPSDEPRDAAQPGASD